MLIKETSPVNLSTIYEVKSEAKEKIEKKRKAEVRYRKGSSENQIAIEKGSCI